MFSRLTVVTLFVLSASAAPAILARQATTRLSSSQISAFKPYTYFASAAFCLPSTTLPWNCGVNCDANPGFQTTASGGDGDSTQYWYVGYDPSLQEVIVSHQGTNTSELLPDLTDADLFLTPFDPALFPGVSFPIAVHNGFMGAQAKVAADVLAAVQKTLSTHNTTAVTVTGHSLGAAISVLDSVYLPLHLPPTINFKTIVYGLPRVGNQAFANYLDANINLTHITNKEDIVPTIPGRDLGFHHGSGEIHIEDNGEWEYCPGQDNPSINCSTGAVPIFLFGNSSDHDGPYDGVEIGCPTSLM